MSGKQEDPPQSKGVLPNPLGQNKKPLSTDIPPDKQKSQIKQTTKNDSPHVSISADDNNKQPLRGKNQINAGQYQKITKKEEENYTEVNHLIDLRHAHYRRLTVLELQQAQRGNDTPPHISTEIEDIQDKIIEIDQELAQLKAPWKTPASLRKTDTIAEIVKATFKVDCDTPDELIEATRRALAALLDIPVDQVKIKKAQKGSIIFTMELPKEAAMRLKELFESSDPDILAIKMTDVKLLGKPETEAEKQKRLMNQALEE